MSSSTSGHRENLPRWGSTAVTTDSSEPLTLGDVVIICAAFAFLLWGVPLMLSLVAPAAAHHLFGIFEDGPLLALCISSLLLSVKILDGIEDGSYSNYPLRVLYGFILAFSALDFFLLAITPSIPNSVLWSSSVQVPAKISGDEAALPMPSYQVSEDTVAAAHFWGDNDTARPFVLDKQTIVVPTTGFQLHLVLGFIPVMAPYWSGDLIVHQNGQTESLDVAQAQHDPRLADIPLFPQSLVDRLLDGKDGLISVQGRNTGSPRLIHASNGWYWVVPMFGKTSSVGDPPLTGILVVDARSGRVAIERFAHGALSSTEAEALAVGAQDSAALLSGKGESITKGSMILRGDALYWKFSKALGGRSEDVYVDAVKGTIVPNVPSLATMNPANASEASSRGTAGSASQPVTSPTATSSY